MSEYLRQLTDNGYTTVVVSTCESPEPLEFPHGLPETTMVLRRPNLGLVPRFAPGGQSTQMIVGADASNDATILSFSQRLYQRYGLRRVYYSAFSPVPGAAPCLPHSPPPLRREHRLYQADWLMRFYGFSADEILDATPDGMLATGCDPKLAWALRHREFFPVDLQSAPRET